MEFNERTIPCHSIDTEDHSYRISTGQELDPLSASISAIGLLQPPIVQSKGTEFIVVSGFRRILACRKVGIQQLPVRIPSDSASRLDLATVAVADNSFQRTLNLIEIARSVSLLKPHFESAAALAKTAGILGLPTNPDFLIKAASLKSLPESIQSQLVRGHVALPTALELLALDPSSVSALSEIFETLKLSLNKQREVMTLLNEIAVLEDVAVADILRSGPVRDLLDDKNLDSVQMTQQFRSHLQKRRFPVIFKAETEMLGLIKALPLGRFWHIIPPKHFEAQSYTFKATVRNGDELRQAGKQLERIIRAPELKDIFKLSRKI